MSAQPLCRVAIACGGTGGHLFPGLAVGEELLLRGCAVTLLVSPKEVDQQAVKSISGMEIATLPAVGLTRRGIFGFAAGFWKSYRKAKEVFKANPPSIVLAMGGFTSAPPILAGKAFGAKTFLHEANAIPGRANRWLARIVDGAFVYFPATASLLKGCQAEVAGMPVRPQFLDPVDPMSARMALGLKPELPVLLVMGGSQGASRINQLVVGALPLMAKRKFQILHLTGPGDFQSVKEVYAAQKIPAVVKAFLSEMDFALGAADVAVSRAGASSGAEIAAVGLPSIMIPYPTAADNHQWHNAQAFVLTGAARMLEQKDATSKGLASHILDLLDNDTKRMAMKAALKKWHNPQAASLIADKILAQAGFKSERADNSLPL